MPRSVRLVFSGGLGNQLFQYAVYLYIKYYHKNVKIIPDLNAYRYDAYHQGFEVQKLFNVDFKDTVIKVESYRKSVSHKQSEILRILRLLNLKLRGYKTVYDSLVESPDTLAEIIGKNKNVLLAGFFQNPSFADSVRSEILRNINSDLNLGEDCDNILKLLDKRNTVSIHIRRGDYLNIPSYNVFNGLDYYVRAIEYFKSKLENPLFVVFSNDSQWVKDNLTIDKATIFVECNKGADSYKDLILMSKCNHNIIANSSFSWWGAWLNPNPSKQVVCPTEWFKGKPSSSVVPDSWIKFGN